MNHNHLTVVSVYGHNDGSSSIPSLLKSTAGLPGSRGLLLSITKPTSLPEHIVWRQIPVLSYQQYSLFMIYCLASFIETDFALCVQADGWVLNQHAWTDDFLGYDYIGAPNGVGLVPPISRDAPGFRFNGMIFPDSWQWLKEDNPIGVLNGGFSLRSKKFLNAPRDLGLPYAFDDNSIRQNEDLQLCLFMRSQLVAFGIKFPPVEIAKVFSFEHFLQDLHYSFELDNYFGIHLSDLSLTGPMQIKFSKDGLNPIGASHLCYLIPSLEKIGYKLF